MTESELIEWAKQLKTALENPKLCPRKRAIIEQQLLDACVEITKRRVKDPSRSQS
jgi:hypothetical protein